MKTHGGMPAGGEVLQRLRSCLEYEGLLKHVRASEKPITVDGAASPAQVLMACALARETGRTAVLVVQDLERARAAYGDATLFLGEGVVLLPDRDLAPYEQGPVSPQLAAQRLDGLARLPDLKGGVVVTTIAALHEALPPPSRLKAFEFEVKAGAAVDREQLLHRLVAAGYRRADLVELAGEFSARGGIVDVFCPALGRPLRIELEGDTASSLRWFDPGSQRSLEEIPAVVVGPAAEALLTPEERVALLERLPDPLSTRGAQRIARLRERLEAGGSLEGEERYLPWVLAAPARLADYFPAGTLVMLTEPRELREHSEYLAARAAALYEELTHAKEPLPKAEELISPPKDVWAGLERFGRVFLHEFATVAAPRVSLGARGATFGPKDIPGFRAAVARSHTVVTCESPEERELVELRARDWVAQGPPIGIADGRLSRGFEVVPAGLLLVPARDLLGGVVRRAAPRKAPKAWRDAFADLKPGEPVVHEDYGIGLYQGVLTIPIEGVKQDFFLLEYAESQKLYLPVDQVHRVQRYLGGGKAPQLDKLGNEAWERTKTRVQESLRKYAEELLKLYAERKVAPGRPFPPPVGIEETIAASFPYEETPDQERVIEEVGKDLEGTKPMDRLVCGDVGYGKTEVALRAAFRVAMSGSQAAVLVPTTILAQQHYENFRSRLAGTPLRVELLSRFRSPEQRKRIVAEVAQGRVDVIVGTHALLAKSVAFRHLGLLVIDEEHRFGVKQKERLKELRKSVHVLTLTATPIPRTLNMGMAGLRDLSVIETPPPGRLSVITHVHEEHPTVVREAILREIKRGGQVFYLHNRVQSIMACAEKLRTLVPHAKFVVGHGQMDQHRLEQAMEQFAAGKADVLVCTSIIGAGLDLPNANTLIVERADTFGLADLYQLRGRVGRSNRQAYAYFFYSPQGAPTLDARRRLAAMLEFGELGSGFRLAVRDLEIRGAGNLLGAQQHGALLAVGFDLYTRMLDHAVHELKGEPWVQETPPQVSLGLEAYLPEAYISDARSKLEFYKRLADCGKREELDELIAALRDRFGEPPPPVKLLLGQAEVRILGEKAGMGSVLRREGQLTLAFKDRASLAAALRRAQGLRPRPGPASLSIRAPSEPEAVLAMLREVLHAPTTVASEPAPRRGAGPATRA